MKATVSTNLAYQLTLPLLFTLCTTSCIVMLDDNLLLYGPQIVMYYLYVYDAVESGIKQLNC